MNPLLARIAAGHPGANTVFRVLFSLIFVVAGVGHLRKPAGIVARLEAMNAIGGQVSALLPATWLVMATGALLLVAGLALLFDVRTRVAALVLMACLVPITVSVQLEPGATGPLFKNIALLGGLIHFALAPHAVNASVPTSDGGPGRPAAAPEVP